MSVSIGEMMSAASMLSEDIESPIQQLGKEIDLMRSELAWYESKYPNTDTSKRRERIRRLELIYKTLEKCEPINLMPVIRDKLMEARKQDFRPDCACVWIPLVPNVPDLLHARPAIIDLIGWEIHTAHDYALVGAGNAGGFVTSNLDD